MTDGYFQGASLAGVDPRLLTIMSLAAQRGLPQGYTVRATSGVRPNQHYGYHPKGLAADFQIYDPRGTALANRGEDSTGLYTALAKAAYAAQMERYPDLRGKLAWGGAFGTVPGGRVADLMHFDLGGERGLLHPDRWPSRLAGATMVAQAQNTGVGPHDFAHNSQVGAQPPQVAQGGDFVLGAPPEFPNLDDPQDAPMQMAEAASGPQDATDLRDLFTGLGGDMMEPTDAGQEPGMAVATRASRMKQSGLGSDLANIFNVAQIGQAPNMPSLRRQG